MRTDIKAPGCRRLVRNAETGEVLITCDAFLRYYKIPYDETHRIEPYEDQVNNPGVMMIELP